jgi:hypothetical protein
MTAVIRQFIHLLPKGKESGGEQGFVDNALLMFKLGKKTGLPPGHELLQVLKVAKR